MKLVILDRDGVINHDSKHYIKSPEEWRPIESALEAIAMLTQSDYTIAVASNQSGVARGYYTHKDLASIHDKMHRMVEEKGGKIDKIVYCPHHPDDACACRKPAPGMLHTIASHYQIELKGIHFIGDRLSDVVCAKSCGATPVLIYSPMTQESTDPVLDGVKCYNTLKDAVLDLLICEDKSP